MMKKVSWHAAGLHRVGVPALSLVYQGPHPVENFMQHASMFQRLNDIFELSMYHIFSHITPPEYNAHLAFQRQNEEKRIFSELWLHIAETKPNLQLTHCPFPT